MTTQSITTHYIFQAWLHQLENLFKQETKIATTDLTELTNAQRKDIGLPLVEYKTLPCSLTDRLW